MLERHLAHRHRRRAEGLYRARDSPTRDVIIRPLPNPDLPGACTLPSFRSMSIDHESRLDSESGRNEAPPSSMQSSAGHWSGQACMLVANVFRTRGAGGHFLTHAFCAQKWRGRRQQSSCVGRCAARRYGTTGLRHQRMCVHCGIQDSCHQ